MADTVRMALDELLRNEQLSGDVDSLNEGAPALA